jgi:hypothetical protein
MRRIIDVGGNEWDVQVGRESYGMHVALFMPVSGGGEVCQTMLGAETWLEAEQAVADASDDELREQLVRARPWGDPAGPGF